PPPNTPDRRMLADFGLQSTAADAEYFSKTLPQIAAGDISSAQHDALLSEVQAAGSDAAAAYLHLRDFIARTFFESSASDSTPAVPKAAYPADHFALGEAEHDWALRNNLRVADTAAALFTSSWPVVQKTRAEMVELARQIAASHNWPAAADGPATVKAVFEQLAQDAPRTDAEMVEGYHRTGQRVVA